MSLKYLLLFVMAVQAFYGDGCDAPNSSVCLTISYCNWCNTSSTESVCISNGNEYDFCIFPSTALSSHFQIIYVAIFISILGGIVLTITVIFGVYVYRDKRKKSSKIDLELPKI